MDEFHKRSGKRRDVSNRRLRKHMTSRLSPEERKRRKQAARARRAEQESSRRPRRRGPMDEDDEVLFEPMAPRPGPVATDGATGRDRGRGARGGRAAAAGADAIPADGAGTLGVVVESARGRVTILVAGERLVVPRAPARSHGASRPGGRRRPGSGRPEDGAGTALVVGDEVEVEPTGPGAPRIVAVRPRRRVLSRADPGRPECERVLVANVDTGVIVVPAAACFRPGLVDRFLVALGQGGIEPIVCCNKIDLLPHGASRAALVAEVAPYRDMGLPVVLASATSGEGLDELLRHLAGRAAVLLGHSGVGKSSLLNALDPEGARRTGAVRAADGKGRHTTTSSCWRRTADGTVLVDTPGLRELALWHPGPEDLARAFPDLVALAAGCRFRDCRHRDEPRCAVRAAVADGSLFRARLASWHRLTAPAGDG